MHLNKSHVPGPGLSAANRSRFPRLDHITHAHTRQEKCLKDALGSLLVAANRGVRVAALRDHGKELARARFHTTASPGIMRCGDDVMSGWRGLGHVRNAQSIALMRV